MPDVVRNLLANYCGYRPKHLIVNPHSRCLRDGPVYKTLDNILGLLNYGTLEDLDGLHMERGTDNIIDLVTQGVSNKIDTLRVEELRDSRGSLRAQNLTVDIGSLAAQLSHGILSNRFGDRGEQHVELGLHYRVLRKVKGKILDGTIMGDIVPKTERSLGART